MAVSGVDGSSFRSNDAVAAEYCHDGFGTLVVGVDGSETSWRALYYAFGLARRQAGRIVAVFVVNPSLGYAEVALADCYHVTTALADEIRPVVDSLSAEYGVRASFVTVSGEPVGTLVKIVQKYQADALILGASQAMAHRVMGSKSLRAVRRSCCPVTVVP